MPGIETGGLYGEATPSSRDSTWSVERTRPSTIGSDRRIFGRELLVAQSITLADAEMHSGNEQGA